MRIMFCNDLIVKKLFNNELIWKPLFIFFKKILFDKHVNHPKFTSLLSLIAESQPHWKVAHYSFIVTNKCKNVFCHANYASFSNN